MLSHESLVVFRRMPELKEGSDAKTRRFFVGTLWIFSASLRRIII